MLKKLLVCFSRSMSGEDISSQLNERQTDTQWRMGFIRIRQAVDRRIKTKKKKTLPDIHEDNSPAFALSFSFFVKLWLWGNMLLWMSRPFHELKMWSFSELQWVRHCVGQKIREARWQTMFQLRLTRGIRTLHVRPFALVSYVNRPKKNWD